MTDYMSEACDWRDIFPRVNIPSETATRELVTEVSEVSHFNFASSRVAVFLGFEKVLDCHYVGEKIAMILNARQLLKNLLLGGIRILVHVEPKLTLATICSTGKFLDKRPQKRM